MNDRTLGKLLLTLMTIFIVYYILWIGISPFIDRSHFTQDLFPPREYGLLLASLIMVGGMGITITVASIHTIKQTGYHPELREKNTNINNAANSNDVNINSNNNNNGHSNVDYLNTINNMELSDKMIGNGIDVPIKTLLSHLEGSE